MVWMYIALLPTVQESQAQFQEIVKTLPENLIKALGIADVDMSSLESLLALKHYNLMWPIIAAFLLISLAAALISGEIENRTIEITLSSALNRSQIFLGKYVAGLLFLLIFVVSTTLFAVPLAIFYNYSYNFQSHLTIMYLSLAFAFAIYSLSICFSAIFSSKGRVYFVMAMMLVLMYVLYIISTLKESLADLKYLSFFYYYNFSDALLHQKIDEISLWVFLGLGLLSSIAAYLVFNKRDIAT